MLETEFLIRVLAAVGAGFLMGLDRQLRNKPVGFGTYTLVATGSAVMVAATDMVYQDAGVVFPVVTGLVAGLGFLGAGALIKEGAQVTGFTTAAAIWLTGALGIAFGLGLFLLGGLAFLTVMGVFLLDPLFERIGVGAHAKQLSLSLDPNADPRVIIDGFRRFRPKVVGFSRRPNKVTFVLRVAVPVGRLHLLEERCRRHPEIVSFKVE